MFQISSACSLGVHISSVCFIVLGVGLIRSNIICIGADYAVHHTQLSMAEYFLLYYVAIGFGQTLGYALQLIDVKLTAVTMALVSELHSRTSLLTVPMYSVLHDFQVCCWLLATAALRKRLFCRQTRNLFRVLKHMICCKFCDTKVGISGSNVKKQSWNIIESVLRREEQTSEGILSNGKQTCHCYGCCKNIYSISKIPNINICTSIKP